MHCYLLKVKQRSGDLTSFLQHRNNIYRKLYVTRDKLRKIANQIDISERTDFLGRIRPRDLEADLVMVKQHHGAVVTPNKR